MICQPQFPLSSNEQFHLVMVIDLRKYWVPPPPPPPLTQQHYNIPIVVGTPQHYAIYSKIIYLIMALDYNKL